MRLAYVVPVGLFMALAVAFAVGLGLEPSKVPSPLIDKPIPAFALPPLIGDTGFSSGDFGGRPVLVNVFASWCVPCRVEHPLLMRLAKEGRWVIFGINYKDSPDAAKRFLAELGNPYQRIGADRSGRISIDWGVYGVPETFAVDAAGRIRYKHIGPLTAEAVETHLNALLPQAGK
jgi:cytochrome c biogenesis protein CcmG, thiol:disulfide interchange protein DsbE